jgi:Peptidase family M23
LKRAGNFWPFLFSYFLLLILDIGFERRYIAGMSLLRTIVCLFFCLAAFPAGAQDIVLDVPLVCTFGTDCWIQQYADHDTSTGVKDYQCADESYDGHDGTDFRIQNTAAQIAVQAGAAGVVKAMRDGVEDHILKTPQDRAAVEKIECGNGVVINHAGSWQTQYCHMRKGSIMVKPGQVVQAGAKLGEVGYSGGAAFPHVHLTLRHLGKIVDPFNPSANCENKAKPLWNADAQKVLSYHQGDIIGFGFHDGPVDVALLETGEIKTQSPAAQWSAMVAYFWAINLSKGDKITVTLRGPGGLDQSNSVTLDRNKAQYLLFSGKKQPVGGWPLGLYSGQVTVENGGAARLKQDWQAELK